jgi:hypothetical protein
MIPVETWFPVVTLLVGAGAGWALEAWREHRTRDREAAARAVAYREAQRLRQLEFQKITLLALQEQTTKFARLIGRMHHNDIMSHRKDGVEWGKVQMPEGLSTEILAAQQQISMLHVRVEDEAIRTLAQRLGTVYSSTAMAKSEDEAYAAMSPLSDILGAMNNRIGEILRQNG